MPAVQDETAFRGDLWVSLDEDFTYNTLTGSHAALERRDPVSGRLIDRYEIGGDAETISPAFGSLWSFSASNSIIRRIDIPLG